MTLSLWFSLHLLVVICTTFAWFFLLLVWTCLYKVELILQKLNSRFDDRSDESYVWILLTHTFCTERKFVGQLFCFIAIYLCVVLRLFFYFPASREVLAFSVRWAIFFKDSSLKEKKTKEITARAIERFFFFGRNNLTNFNFSFSMCFFAYFFVCFKHNLIKVCFSLVSIWILLAYILFCLVCLSQLNVLVLFPISN